MHHDAPSSRLFFWSQLDTESQTGRRERLQTSGLYMVASSDWGDGQISDAGGCQRHPKAVSDLREGVRAGGVDDSAGEHSP